MKCQFSAYALAKGHTQRTGKIVGETRCKTCWYIIWDGNSNYTRNRMWHKSLIEEVKS